MQVILNKLSSINNLFVCFHNRKVEYAWLHSYSRDDWGDIDIAVSLKDFETIDSTIERFCEKTNFRIIQILKHEYCAKYFVLGKIAENSIEYLIPDICTHYVREGRILLKADKLLYKRQYSGNFFSCNDLVQAEYIFLKRSLKEKWNEGHYYDFRHIYFSNKEDIEIGLAKYLDDSTKNNFIESMKLNDINLVNGLSNKIRKCILFNTFLSNPAAYANYQTKNFIRILKRIARPTGLFVVILGTDGSGKSTVIEKLKTELAPAFRGTIIYHWKPEFLKKHTTMKKTVNEPHNMPSRSRITSILKIIFYVWQYFLGYYLKIHTSKIRSNLNLFDRYYYDIFVDQKRFRMNLPLTLIRCLALFVPKPDLVFYLYTDPSIAYERKKELNICELERQTEKFLSLRNYLGDRFYVIDNNKNLEKTSKDIINVVFNFLEKRLK